MSKWNWQYGRWLVMLRKALLSTGCFENGVYPDAKAWWDYYKFSQLTPLQAVKEDLGVSPSYYYMSWRGRYPST